MMTTTHLAAPTQPAQACYWCGSTVAVTEYQNPGDWDMTREPDCPTIALCAACLPPPPEPDACAEHPICPPPGVAAVSHGWGAFWRTLENGLREVR